MRISRPLSFAIAAAVFIAACSSGTDSTDGAAPETPSPISTVAPSSSSAPATTVPEPSNEELGLVAVSGEELQAALGGNTIVGNWVGQDYRQFFDLNGDTTYLAEGGPASPGTWRVNVTTGQYESMWPPLPQWDVYDVFRDGDEWFWTGGGVELSPFTIVEGDQLTVAS